MNGVDKGLGQFHLVDGMILLVEDKDWLGIRTAVPGISLDLLVLDTDSLGTAGTTDLDLLPLGTDITGLGRLGQFHLG